MKGRVLSEDRTYQKRAVTLLIRTVQVEVDQGFEISKEVCSSKSRPLNFSCVNHSAAGHRSFDEQFFQTFIFDFLQFHSPLTYKDVLVPL